MCIREAVMASCAIPGIFPPVTLAAKDRNGERRPYVSSRQWVDGSGCGRFAGQAIVAPLWRQSLHYQPDQPCRSLVSAGFQGRDDIIGRLWEINPECLHRQWLRATYPFAMQVVRDMYPINVWTRMFYSIATQDYTADINIIPRQKFRDPRKLLAVLTEHETSTLIHEGEVATWPRVEMIRNCTKISFTLDAILERLEDQSLYAHA
ncbi:MAG: hypothetical protein U5O39_08015 [Gammaproteobacteria bacterium]|nr:hypothetical protein [Gammaproteobacteria bacterium]